MIKDIGNQNYIISEEKNVYINPDKNKKINLII